MTNKHFLFFLYNSNIKKNTQFENITKNHPKGGATLSNYCLKKSIFECFGKTKLRELYNKK